MANLPPMNGRMLLGAAMLVSLRSISPAALLSQVVSMSRRCGSSRCDQSSIIANAAFRSPDFNFRNNARAFLISLSEPLSAAKFRATVVG